MARRLSASARISDPEFLKVSFPRGSETKVDFATA
jgi:hypothetical protein